MAECLVRLFADDIDDAVAAANESLASYSPTFDRAYDAGMRRKLGLITEQEGDAELARDLLNAMAAHNADFTLTFRTLCDAAEAAENDEAMRSRFDDGAAFDQWAVRWRRRLQDEPGDPVSRAHAMRRVNPAFIPRNHRVEAVIRAAEEDHDFAPFHQLVQVLARPFAEQPEFAHYMLPPQPHEQVHQTFCGT